MKKLAFVAAVCVVMCLGLPHMKTQAEPGDTLRVPQDYSTIQAGINAATDGDTVLVADGTYTGTGNKDLDFGGKAITVKSENGPNNCIIDCENSGRGFVFNSGEGSDCIVEGFTVKNGNAFEGGAVYFYAQALYGSVTAKVRNCILENNSSSFGGAVFMRAATAQTSPTIENCIIRNNSATTTTCRGGGVYIKANSSDYACSPKFLNTLIAGNQTLYYGGGVFVTGYASPTFTNCTVADNANTDPWFCAGGGIAVYDSNASATITNTILWGNTSAWSGSQLYVKNGASVTVSYSDVQDKTSGGVNGPVTWGDGVIDSDPLFVGSGDYHLKADSPCIDAGNNTAATGDYDWDGNARILDGDKDETATVDIGFYEAHPDWSPNAVISDAPQLDLIAPVPAGLTDAGSFFAYSSVNNTIYYYKKSGDAWLEPEVVDDNIPNVIQIAVADITGNDLPDVYALAQADANIYWYENLGNPFVRRDVVLDCASKTYPMVPIGEDLLVVEWAPDETVGRISVWENSGGETITFSKKPLFADEFYHGITLLSAGDINSDGKIDAVAAKPGGPMLWLENVTDAGNLDMVPRMITYKAPEDLTALAVLDSDGDTFADIGMIAEASPAHMTIYKNDGGAWFTAVDNPLGVARVLTLAPVKVDADAMPDFMSLDASQRRISWWKNKFDHSPQPESANLVYMNSTIDPTYT